MHVLHYLAVEAESKNEATSRADTILNESLESGGTWFDWFVVGGGRFTTPEGSAFEEAYNDTFDNTISYTEDSEKFESLLAERVRIRKEQFAEHLSRVDEKVVKQAVEDFKQDKETSYPERLDIYNLKRLTETLLGYWNEDSYLYDVESYDCDVQPIKDRIKNNPTQQFLVPIDFHF